MNRDNQENNNIFQRTYQTVMDSKFVMAVCDAWARLPKLHQRALTILIPVVLIMLILPIGSEVEVDNQQVEKAEPSRVAVPLIIDGEETTATKPKPKPEETDKSKRVTVSGPQTNSQEQASKDSDKAQRVVSDQAGPQPWHNYTVKKGDTLSQVFRNNNLSLSDINDLVAVEGKGKPLSQIKEGQLIRFKLTNRGNLDILEIQKDGESIMFFRLSSGGFSKTI